MSLSVVLATYNEEANLEACLKSVKALADEIVIVDGQSQDKTVQIAEQYRAKVISVPNDPHFHAMKQRAVDEAKGEWILQLDADERVSPELKEEIRELTKSETLPAGRQERKVKNGFAIPRRNWFLGRFLTKGGAYPDPVVRLFKKGYGVFPSVTKLDNGITTSNVHAQIQIDGEVGMLTKDLIHNGDPSLDKYLNRFNRYTSLEAENLKKEGLRPAFATATQYLFLKPLYWFCLRYFRHRGYVDGYQGFLFALFSALHYPVIYMKVVEK